MQLPYKDWCVISGLLHMMSFYGGRQNNDDFDVARYVPEVEHRRAIMKRYYAYNGDPENYTPSDDYTFEHAWLLASFYKEEVYHPERLKNWELRLIAALLRHGARRFEWQGTEWSYQQAAYMRVCATTLYTEDEAILAQE